MQMNENDERPSNFDLVIGMLQVFDLLLNVGQTSNDVLLQELQRQDKILADQTNNYLKTIVEQNNKILEHLEKGERKEELI